LITDERFIDTLSVVTVCHVKDIASRECQ